MDHLASSLFSATAISSIHFLWLVKYSKSTERILRTKKNTSVRLFLNGDLNTRICLTMLTECECMVFNCDFSSSIYVSFCLIKHISSPEHVGINSGTGNK